MIAPMSFERIAVIGAGTMGAGIAGQIANAGHDVLLLDLPGGVAERAVERLLASEPPALLEPRVAERISTGNIEDDLHRLGDCDWVVEAIVERLELKRSLYRRLSAIVPPDCVITSNTSTLPISLLVEGQDERFAQRFAITHYFNPVRYMRLLELVGGARTDPDVLRRLADVNAAELGKGVVRCGDTPGFLGNRIGVFALQVGIDEAQRLGLPIERADALMGRPMGIPKTGVFGLYDLIGVDLMADVVRSLAAILPPDDAFHAVADTAMIDAMVGDGLTGNKGDGGFYRRDEEGTRVARVLGDGRYRPLETGLPARAVRAAEDIAANREPLVTLIEGEDADARFCRAVLARVLGYAAGLLGTISDSPQAMDDAMKLGFNWLRGPFEMIDALGAACTMALLQEHARPVPVVLERAEPFYRVEEGALTVRHADGRRRPPDLPEGAVRWQLSRRTHVPIVGNADASLYAIEGDLRLVEFHSKANALTDDSMAIVAAAAEDHGAGVLVHNDAQHYSAGVDLNAFLDLIDAQDFAGIDAFLARFQDAVTALRACPVPVVGAPSGLSLGGGMEVLLHCDALVVHVNSVMGLVESGVGLLPAGGGLSEALRRAQAAAPSSEEGTWQAWLNLGYGATGSSPVLAAKRHYFLPGRDREVIDRDRLYGEGVARLRRLADGYRAPAPAPVTLAGGDIRERMDDYLIAGVDRGAFRARDRVVAMTIGRVMTSDDHRVHTIDETESLAREREGFLHLARSDETRRRIAALLGR